MFRKEVLDSDDTVLYCNPPLFYFTVT